jgi:hypothetical protein
MKPNYQAIGVLFCHFLRVKMIAQPLRVGRVLERPSHARKIHQYDCQIAITLLIVDAFFGFARLQPDPLNASAL